MIKTSVGRLNCLFFFFSGSCSAINLSRDLSAKWNCDQILAHKAKTPLKKQNKTHGYKSSLPLGVKAKAKGALSPVSISYHLRGLAEHKGRSYRQAVFSSRSCLYSVLSVRKGSVLADGAVTSLVWKSRVYTMTWPDCFSMACLPFFFLAEKKTDLFFLAEKKAPKPMWQQRELRHFFFNLAHRLERFLAPLDLFFMSIW